MREEEKIFAGKLFNNQCDELKAIKRQMHEVNRLVNQLPEWDPEREKLLRNALGKVGKTFHFVGPVHINYGTHTFIGENFFANFNFTVMDDARVFIGDNVAIGPNVSLLATNHPLIAQERMGLDENGNTTLAEYAEDIHIGDNVWLAANVCVIGGVTIGDGAVIGAGSVVARDIPAGYLAVGVPCKPLRPITEADSAQDRLLPEDADYFRNNFPGFKG